MQIPRSPAARSPSPSQMADEAVSAACSCLEPLSGCLLEAARREVLAFLRIKSNWGDLEKARDSLRAVETTVRAAVMAEEDKLNVCDPQVEVWLKRVDELRQDTIDEDYSSLLGFSCLCQCTVHARHRASIGKRVVDALDEVNKLTEEGRQFRTFGFKPPPRAVSRLPQTETVGLEPMLTRLHDLLEKGESSIIGVWGQGGIGKTTLLHAFNNDLEKEDHNYQVLFRFLQGCNLLIRIYVNLLICVPFMNCIYRIASMMNLMVLTFIVYSE